MHPPEQYVLHASVAALVWLQHRPHARDAYRFVNEDVASGLVELMAPSSTYITVLEQVADDLAGAPLGEVVASIIVDDILSLFRLLTASASLTTFAIDPLIRLAFPMAVSNSLSLSDAFAVTLAGMQGVPLIVADATSFATFQLIADERPNLRLAWLPDRYRGQ